MKFAGRVSVHGLFVGLASLAIFLVPALRADDAVELSYPLAPGDTVWSISQTLLAQPNDWQRLVRHNGISKDRKLPPGKIIRIPYAWMKRDQVQIEATQVNGEARWTHPDTSVVAELKSGMRLRSASRIQTGATGHVTVRLGDGSILRIAPGSDVQLHAIQYAGTSVTHVRFQLERGRVETQAAPLRQPASVYEIRTPTAQLGVRGTRFRVTLSQDRGSSTAEVVEGVVAAISPTLASSAPIAVNAGFGTVVRAGQAPLPPIVLLPAPDLSHLVGLDLGPAVNLVGRPVHKAVSYRIQVARDAQFAETVLETTAADPHIRFSNLGTGVLHVRVRAVDTNGLEGQDGQVALRLLEIQL